MSLLCTGVHPGGEAICRCYRECAHWSAGEVNEGWALSPAFDPMTCECHNCKSRTMANVLAWINTEPIAVTFDELANAPWVWGNLSLGMREETNGRNEQ